MRRAIIGHRTGDGCSAYTSVMRGRAGDGALLLGEDGVRAAYAAHGAELYRAACRSLRDSHLAEEAVQETFMRAWRAADRFDDRIGSLRTWLFAILRNTIIDLARADAVRPLRAVRGDGASELGQPVDADELDRALLAWQVEEALGRLSEDHRRVLVEVHLNGRPLGDVAAELGVPVGTVKSRGYYALRALRVVLEELGWADEEAP
jgi:RNA polymerase sigma-70 factor (ECF subfamily)